MADDVTRMPNGPTCLVDLVEFLGAEVAFGNMTKDAAAQRIVEFSEAGITHYGAADLLGNAGLVRAAYRQQGDRARQALRELRGDPS